MRCIDGWSALIWRPIICIREGRRVCWIWREDGTKQMSGERSMLTIPLPGRPKTIFNKRKMPIQRVYQDTIFVHKYPSGGDGEAVVGGGQWRPLTGLQILQGSLWPEICMKIFRSMGQSPIPNAPFDSVQQPVLASPWLLPDARYSYLAIKKWRELMMKSKQYAGGVAHRGKKQSKNMDKMGKAWDDFST